MAADKTTALESFLAAKIDAALLRREAREVGALRRQRKVDIFEFFQVVVLMVCGRGGQSIAEMRRQMAAGFGVHLVRSGFWQRFTPGFERLVSRVLGRLQREAHHHPPALKGALAGFRDVIAVDSTVIKVHDSLEGRWRGTRRNNPAAIKLHTMIRAVTGELLQHRITAEAHADQRELKVGHWAKSRLFLFDRAYRSASSWWRIHRLGGHFVTPLARSFKPVVISENRKHRGAARKLRGRELFSSLEGLKRKVLDVNCEFHVRVRPYRSAKGRRFTHRFRVVGLWRPSKRAYMLFVTNLPADVYPAQAIADLYDLRWEVETFYKTGKSGLGLNDLPSRKPHVVRTLIKAALIRSCIAMHARQEAEKTLPRRRWINPQQWVHVWRERIADVLLGDRLQVLTWSFLARLAVDPNVKRVPLRRRCLLEGQTRGRRKRSNGAVIRPK